jgi:hypothetical protein
MGAKVSSETELPQSTKKLGDWYANVVVIERQYLVLAASSITLLPVVLHAAPFKTLPARLAEAVVRMLGRSASRSPKAPRNGKRPAPLNIRPQSRPSLVGPK